MANLGQINKGRASRSAGSGARLNAKLASASSTLIVRNKVTCEVMLTYVDVNTKESKFVTLMSGSDPVDLYAYAPKVCWQKSDSLRRAANSELIEVIDSDAT